MTKHEFLADPLPHLFRSTGNKLQPEWIKAAWNSPEIQREAVFSLARSVSKTGSLKIAADWLNLLAPALSAQQAVDLYRRVRDETERSESEWRGEFEAAFPESVPLLPPLDRQRELFNRTLALFLAIYFGASDKVCSRLQELLSGGFTLEEAQMTVAEFASLMGDKKCIGNLGDVGLGDVLSALSLASALKRGEIVELLKRGGAK